jgi:hypothetical protein
MSMEISPGRMVYLGYGKYWRSDVITGLMPIEENRGPGRRTEVWVGTRAEPLVASRSERAILQDMVTAPEEIFRMEEARSAVGDLVDAFQEMSPIIKRMLVNEAHFDVEKWEERLRALLNPQGSDEEQGKQPELFA